MQNKRNLLKQGCLVFIFCILAYSIFAQEEKTINTVSLPAPATIQKSQISSTITNINQEDIIREAQRSLDRSIGILNVVATSMGVLVGLITLIMLLVAAFGFFEYRRWRKARKNIEKEVTRIEEIRKRAEKYVNMFRKEISKIPLSLTEKPSEENQQKIDDFNRRLEILELLGVPLKPEDYLKRGFDLYSKNKYELVLKVLDKAIELKPKYVEAWDGKGAALGQLGRYDEALRVFEKAIEFKPNYAEAWNGKGVVLGRLRRYDEALDALNKAIELKRNFVDAWYNKGVTLYKLSRLDEALEAFDKAIELKPNYVEAWDGKGAALNKLSRLNEALDVLNKAIELKPDYANAWYNKACVYSLKDDKENALINLSKAIELDVKYKKDGKEEKDFKKLWDDADFKRIIE